MSKTLIEETIVIIEKILGDLESVTPDNRILCEEIQDKLSQFSDAENDYIDRISELEEELDSTIELLDEVKSNDGTLCSKLRYLGDRLSCTQSQSVQNELMYLLKDELNIDLMVVPQLRS